MGHGAPPIDDYAAIGDCHSAALVSRQGSIDWLCLPRFDSPSIFGRLLDPTAGHWRIGPGVASRIERRYVGDTNVLETRFFTGRGTLRLTDLMPVASEEDKQRLLLADHEVLRIAECEAGEVDLEMELWARPDYGQRTPRIRAEGHRGFRLELPGRLLYLRTDLPVRVDPSGRLSGRVRLRAGETVSSSLTYEDDTIAVLPPLGPWSRQTLARTLAWWNDWSSRLRYDGPYRPAVVRSALALRLLVYGPSGALVAAPTTSLPERLGGPLNWDYRFCWLRDASLTVRALFGLGYRDEAEAFVGWLLHTTRLARPGLRTLYDVYGRLPAMERILATLRGYGGSRPVRTGNAAVDQLQLDVYGEVVDAAAQMVRQGAELDGPTRRLLVGFGDRVCQGWQLPDEGIWEPRSGRSRHTHSLLLCWVALDRLLELQARGALSGRRAAGWARVRACIRTEIEQQAWSPRLGSYVARLGGDEVDASLLLLAWYGFEDARSPRMRGTHARIQAELGAGRGLLYRYRTGKVAEEGAFGVCGFWASEYLALGAGSPEEAAASLERMIATCNDVGLLAEEVDPATGAALGNFPQAFSHVGLINAALSLQRRLRQERGQERR